MQGKVPNGDSLVVVGLGCPLSIEDAMLRRLDFPQLPSSSSAYSSPLSYGLDAALGWNRLELRRLCCSLLRFPLPLLLLPDSKASSPFGLVEGVHRRVVAFPSPIPSAKYRFE